MKKKLSILIFTILIALITIQYKAQKNTLAEIFSLNKSQNPKATEYFLDAYGTMLYLERLHYFVNYDNFLMKPLFYRIDSSLAKGKELLAKNSSEDVFFLVAIYRGIYGLTIDNIRNDRSVDPVKVLSAHEYKMLNEKVYEMLVRYLDIKNDFSINAEGINKYKFLMATNLLNHYYRMYRFQYIDGGKSKSLQRIENKNLLRQLHELYDLFATYSDIYSPQMYNQKKSFANLNFTKARLLTEIYYTRQFQLKTPIISLSVCKDKKTYVLLKSIENLFPYRNMRSKELKSSIFLDGFVIKIVKAINKSCVNVKKQSNEVLKLIKRVKDGK